MSVVTRRLILSLLIQSLHPPSPYDLVKFFLEHPTTYRHHGFVKSDVSDDDGGGHVPNLCRVPVKIMLQNCYCQKSRYVCEYVLFRSPKV